MREQSKTHEQTHKTTFVYNRNKLQYKQKQH